MVPRIALLSTSDTDLLSARASGADYVLANPARAAHTELAAVLEACDLIVARILGSPQMLCSGFDRFRATGKPMVVLGGEQAPDAALMELSTVPLGVAADAHVYLAQGGPENLSQLHAFLSDTVLLTGVGFEAPLEQPVWGVLPRAARDDESRPRIGILFYRAQHAAGNTAYVEALADAVDAAGGVGVPIFAASLRSAPSDLLDYLASLMPWSRRCWRPAARSRRPPPPVRTTRAGTYAALAALDIPILQGLCLTWDRASWADSDEGMTPLDVATQVAVPEFDGRIITVPFSFKETDADGLPALRRPTSSAAAGSPRSPSTTPGCAVSRRRSARSRSSCRPIRPSTPGSATRSGWTPRCRSSGCCGRCATPATTSARRATSRAPERWTPIEGEHPDTTAGNALIHALIAAGGQDPEWLTAEQLSGQPVRIPAATYRRWLAELPADLVPRVTAAWGEAPGELFVDRQPGPGRGDRGRHAAGRQRGDPGPAAARLRREPDRDLPRS